MKNPSKFFFGLFIMMSMFLVVNAQVENPAPEQGSDTLETISFILNAILGVMAYFFNSSKEKAKEAAVKAEGKVLEVSEVAKTKLTQASALFSKIVNAFADDKITPDEIKGIAESGKELTRI